MKIQATQEKRQILGGKKMDGYEEAITGELVDMCPHCKEQDDDLFWVGNELDYDDMGLTCCQECMDANPAWQRAWQTISHY